jgi:hypothetical protein
MADRYNDVINVKDWGAKGDGTTDDTDALWSAVIYAYSSASRGATIFFPAGTYRLNSWTWNLSPAIWIITTTTGTAGVTNSATFRFVPSALYAGLQAFSGPFSGLRIQTVVGSTITFSGTARANFGLGTEVAIAISPVGPSSHGDMFLVGVGRDASIIRGNINDFLVQVRQPWSGTYCNGLHNLTIWNESTGSISGAFFDSSNMNNWIGFYNCTFIGYVGAHLGWQSFGVSIHSCNFYCSNIISAAAPTGPPPSPVFPTAGQSGILPGSVGLYFAEGEITSCFAEGFDTGYALSQNTIAMYGNRASRCNTGINLGLSNNPSGITHYHGQVNVFANLCDRCAVGIVEWGAHGGRFSNVVCGNTLNDVKTGLTAGPYSDGVLEPAAIASISVAAGTATVTTTQPHGLTIGSDYFTELILSPVTLTPDGSGNQNVVVHVTGASAFTYSLGGAGTFSNPGTWNSPNIYGVSGPSFRSVGYFSNILTSRPFGGSFSLSSTTTGTGSDSNCFVCATQGPYGWKGPNHGNDPNQVNGSAFTYVMCGLPASASLRHSPSNEALPNPIAYLKFAALSGNAYEGKEVTIVDGQKKGGGKAAFHDIVSGGGSDHYKVRYDGKNWRRVG